MYLKYQLAQIMLCLGITHVHPVDRKITASFGFKLAVDYFHDKYLPILIFTCFCPYCF